jgi:hypothetical protein
LIQFKGSYPKSRPNRDIGGRRCCFARSMQDIASPTRPTAASCMQPAAERCETMPSLSRALLLLLFASGPDDRPSFFSEVSQSSHARSLPISWTLASGTPTSCFFGRGKPTRSRWDGRSGVFPDPLAAWPGSSWCESRRMENWSRGHWQAWGASRWRARGL